MTLRRKSVSRKSSSKLFTLKEFSEKKGYSIQQLNICLADGMPKKKSPRSGKDGRPPWLLDELKAGQWLVAHGVTPQTFRNLNSSSAKKSAAALSIPDHSQSVAPPVPEKSPTLAAISSTESLESNIEKIYLMLRASWNGFASAASTRAPDGSPKRPDLLNMRANQQLFIDACDAVVKLRKQIADEDALRRALADEYNTAVRQLLAPLAAQLHTMPRALAQRANPPDPHTAELTLRDWVEKQILPMMSRPLTAAPIQTSA